MEGLYWGYMGIMENKIETTIVYRGYMFGSLQSLQLTDCCLCLCIYVLVD